MQVDFVNETPGSIVVLDWHNEFNGAAWNTLPPETILPTKITAQLTLPDGGLAGFQYKRTDADPARVKFELKNNGGAITCMRLCNNPTILDATFDERSLPGKVTIQLFGQPTTAGG